MPTPVAARSQTSVPSGGAHALAHAHHHGVLLFQELGDAVDEDLLVERDLGKQHDVGPGERKRAGRGEPAGVAAHDLDEGHALEVVDVRVVGDLVHGRGDEAAALP